MSESTGIQWTDATWNPASGCSKVSQGCKHCYAERDFRRPYPGREFTDVQTHPNRLEQPLRWRRPRRIFVNSMSDLFHEDVPDAFIDQVWAVMALSPQHTFQILTKRPERMREYASALYAGRRPDFIAALMGAHWGDKRTPAWISDACQPGTYFGGRSVPPLPNVWLGVSVEDQETADERIPLLLETPAAVRFISAEPLLGDVRLGSSLDRSPSAAFTAGKVTADMPAWTRLGSTALDWVIVGGESGPKARPCDVGWIRSVVGECKYAGVPVFVKQLGARTTGWCFGNCDSDGVDWTRNADEADVCQSHEASEGAECPDGRCCMRRDRKGGDPTEWPADLRLREFPTC